MLSVIYLATYFSRRNANFTYYTSLFIHDDLLSVLKIKFNPEDKLFCHQIIKKIVFEKANNNLAIYFHVL